MDPLARDLNRWIPRLLTVWRQARKLKDGPDDRLLPQEMREVAAAVRTLSQGLTRERELAGARYMEDPKLLGGYLLFYWPVSYAQARHALRELGRPGTVLDLGSGPGPLAMACADAGAREVTAADRSSAALELLRNVAGEGGEAVATRSWNALSGDKLPDDRFDLITMGHMLNELWGAQDDAVPRRAGLIERTLGHLRPGGSILVIEPALRETSRGLLQVRDRLVEKGFLVRSPCLFSGACPALVRETDWCHAERPWTPPQLVADIGRAAGLRKEALKMSYLLLGAPGTQPAALPPGRLFRIVSEPLASKGRQRFMGCGPEGRVGLSLQEKHINEGNVLFSRLQRGDVVRVVGTEERGDGLSLGAESTVEMVARAGEQVRAG